MGITVFYIMYLHIWYNTVYGAKGLETYTTVAATYVVFSFLFCFAFIGKRIWFSLYFPLFSTLYTLDPLYM
jgi:hypothetical protein